MKNKMQDERESAITVRDVKKTFRLPHETHSGFKQYLINIFKQNKTKGYETQEVLKGVSFEIKKGEFFGIVGRNGSGKSTLLKLLAGIYTPDSGAIETSGTLVPFIELGVGFNPELTGRENVFLNGALLGFSRQEIETMYDEIVDFAEIERFMDQKLKNYSSGMQVRLAFSIAIKAQGDVLILDEVLAVGDEAFQRKCLDVFENYKATRQTVVLVTHDMAMVKKYCTRAVLISEGKIIVEGSPHDVSEEYTRLNNTSIDDYTTKKNILHSEFLKVDISDKTGKKKTRFDVGETMNVKLSWPKDHRVENAGVAIVTSTGEEVYATNTFFDKVIITGNVAYYEVNLSIGAGRYHVMAGTFLKSDSDIVDFVNHGPDFTVEDKKKQFIGTGITQLNHRWS